MKLLLNGIFVSLFYFSNGQEGSECQILGVLLKNKNAQKAFFFDDYKHLPIVFIDPKGYFSKCTIAEFNKRQVEIVHDSSFLDQKSVSYIIIKNFQKRKHNYNIEVFQRNTGAYARVKLRGRKQRIKISKFDLGYF